MLYQDRDLFHCVGDGKFKVKAQLALQGYITPFAPWGIEQHPHTRLSSEHQSDTICKDLRRHLKTLAF